MQQTACFVFNQIMVDNFASLFICTIVRLVSDGMKLLLQEGSHRSFAVCGMAHHDSTCYYYYYYYYIEPSALFHCILSIPGVKDKFVV